MKQMKTPSVGPLAQRSERSLGKALMGLMLSVAVIGMVGCGQKRPLQLPTSGKAAGTGSATAPAAVRPAPVTPPAAKGDPASAPASAAVMPQR